ncbi:MAG: NAD-dependent epimerase/dehydratase family protein, partial [Planctomycetota bacterium]
MKILLTGGAGFIGSHLLDALLARGDEVTVVDDFNDYYDPGIKRRNVEGKNFRLVEADIRDASKMDALAAAGPDVLVHLAARAGVRASVEDPVLYSDVNVRGTLGLFELCRAHGVKRVVYASSSSVYGDAPVPFSEGHEGLRPVSP